MEFERFFMSPSQSVAYTVTSNEPTRIEVTALDGQRYEVRLTLALVQIRDAGVPHPADPSLPTFEIQAAMVPETRRIS